MEYFMIQFVGGTGTEAPTTLATTTAAPTDAPTTEETTTEGNIMINGINA